MKFETLVGLTLISAERGDSKSDYAGSEAIKLETDSYEYYEIVHHSDCCERVDIEDIDDYWESNETVGNC